MIKTYLKYASCIPVGLAAFFAACAVGICIVYVSIGVIKWALDVNFILAAMAVFVFSLTGLAGLFVTMYVSTCAAAPCAVVGWLIFLGVPVSDETKEQSFYFAVGNVLKNLSSWDSTTPRKTISEPLHHFVDRFLT